MRCLAQCLALNMCSEVLVVLLLLLSLFSSPGWARNAAVGALGGLVHNGAVT